MDTSKLKPNDPRVQYLTATIRGKTYSYILGEPQGPKVETMVLAHGFPDLAFGWRNQIPYFMSLGFQVIAPNMIGYAGTDAPEDLSQWSLKSVADDLAELARKYVGQDGQIILGGHDWGGAAIWRTAFWHPELIKAVFSVCTPLHGLSPEYASLEDIIAAGGLPTFRYQLQFKGSEVQDRIQGKDQLRKFFSGLFGGRTPTNDVAFNSDDGVLFEHLEKIGPPLLMNEEELEYYVEQYSLQKKPELRGPLNWYRTRQVNYEEEAERAKNGPPIWFEMPALFISATKDAALPPSMSAGMEDYYKDLTRDQVDTTHWSLIQASDEVNSIITKWLNKALNGAIKAAL